MEKERAFGESRDGLGFTRWCEGARVWRELGGGCGGWIRFHPGWSGGSKSSAVWSMPIVGLFLANPGLVSLTSLLMRMDSF